MLFGFCGGWGGLVVKVWLDSLGMTIVILIDFGAVESPTVLHCYVSCFKHVFPVSLGFPW